MPVRLLLSSGHSQVLDVSKKGLILACRSNGTGSCRLQDGEIVPITLIVLRICTSKENNFVDIDRRTILNITRYKYK